MAVGGEGAAPRDEAEAGCLSGPARGALAVLPLVERGQRRRRGRAALKHDRHAHAAVLQRRKVPHDDAGGLPRVGPPRAAPPVCERGADGRELLGGGRGRGGRRRRLWHRRGRCSRCRCSRCSCCFCSLRSLCRHFRLSLECCCRSPRLVKDSLSLGSRGRLRFRHQGEALCRGGCACVSEGPLCCLSCVSPGSLCYRGSSRARRRNDTRCLALSRGALLCGSGSTICCSSVTLGCDRSARSLGFAGCLGFCGSEEGGALLCPASLGICSGPRFTEDACRLGLCGGSSLVSLRQRSSSLRSVSGHLRLRIRCERAL